MMRPTDFCHLLRFACTRTSCVPGSLRDFHRVDTSSFRRNRSRDSNLRRNRLRGPRSLGLRAVFRGTECFTTLANASADRSWTRFAFCLEPSRSVSVRGDKSVGIFFPRRPLPIEPLTSLSPLPLPWDVGAPSRPFSLIALASIFASRVRKPPRSP